MTYYILNGKYYYDYHFLLGVSKLTSSQLNFIIKKEGIGRVKYKDTYIYKLEDLYRSPVFAKFVEVNVVDVEGESI